MFVNAIDFSGHNMFELESAPLSFLVCPGWLYNLMHSHIVTSNRCSRLCRQTRRRESCSANPPIPITTLPLDSCIRIDSTGSHSRCAKAVRVGFQCQLT